MAHTLDWIVDERVIYLRNEGELAAAEMERVSQKLAQMSEKGVAPIHIIEDDRQLEGMKSISIDALEKAFTGPDYDKFGWAVVIMPEKLKTISDVVGNVTDLISDIEYERVETLPEALEFLSKHDATLPERSKWRLPQG